MEKGTEHTPFESAQVLLRDTAGKLAFHKNSSIISGTTKLTLFGGKVEEQDENAFIRAIIEVKEEAWIILLPSNLRKVGEDGPFNFEKGWFLAHIYDALLSPDSFGNIQNAQIFSSYQHFLNTGEEYNWGRNFSHMRLVVDRILWN